MFASFGIITPRIRIARERLTYAAAIARDAPSDFWQLLEHEHSLTPKLSWLADLTADLEWLKQMNPHLEEIEWFRTWEGCRRYWNEHPSKWNNLVKRTVKKHVLQEQTMADVHTWHSKIQQQMMLAGAVFEGPLHKESTPLVDASEPQSSALRCFCGKLFFSARALGVHKYRAHKQHAQEYYLASGATCRACLRHFWSTTRLRQHLAYAPRSGKVNECFQKLFEHVTVTDPPVVFKVDKQLKGINRLDALQMSGPVGLGRTSLEKTMDDLQCALSRTRSELQTKGVLLPPDEALLLEVHQSLAAVTTDWACGGDLNVAVLQGAWIDVLAATPAVEAEAVYAFIRWENRDFEDVLEEILDPGAREKVEEALSSLLRDLDLTPLVRKMDKLKHEIMMLPLLHPKLLGPHRPVYKGAANDTERLQVTRVIFQAFEMQEAQRLTWQNSVLRVPMAPVDTIPYLVVDGKPTFVVVHLFAGRRRRGDFHDALMTMSSSAPYQILVLSFDTAIDSSAGDLRAGSLAWKHLEHWFSHGLLAAGLSGNPCETFSQARFNKVVDDQGKSLRCPRPLRSSERLWGLRGLGHRELRQVAQGTSFSLQTLWGSTCMLRWGGVFVAEHPAPPDDPTRPSEWTAPVTLKLRSLRNARLHIVQQWKFGSPPPKPTGLFVTNHFRFASSLQKWEDASLMKPPPAKMGRTSTGYTTAVMKEYPWRLSHALAQAIYDRIDTVWRHRQATLRSTSEAELTWMRQIAALCAPIDPERTMGADFQDLPTL